jgi:hypothetical protein
MATSPAARRRNWTPRGIIIAALAGWRALWHRSAATAVATPVAAAMVIGVVALPLISHAPAPRHGHAAVRTHHQRRRMAAVTAPGRGGRHHGHGAVQGGGEPVGTVTGTPILGNQPDPPPPGQPLPPPVQLPVPPVPTGDLPGPVPSPPVDLPPVELPLPGPPVELPLPPVGPVQLPPVGHLPPVPPGQQFAQPVTGAAGDVGGLLGGT